MTVDVSPPVPIMQRNALGICCCLLSMKIEITGICVDTGSIILDVLLQDLKLLANKKQKPVAEKQAGAENDSDSSSGSDHEVQSLAVFTISYIRK